MEGNLTLARRTYGLQIENRNKSSGHLQYCKLVEGWNEENLKDPYGNLLYVSFEL